MVARSDSASYFVMGHGTISASQWVAVANILSNWDMNELKSKDELLEQF
jgi:hypothetical protein